ncbi:hypothetical protein GUJ93_ZPchr0004g38281 [Zizania palustris]|uniref:Uncharacterized protein n=1 Tax=Zizania palustris TaxID=103762 RepID=A0A8J5S5C5_ZIZPA|nr:hypothetical protein GUJ93_ZPchr0004g38281 [Zizania palustris]
MGISGWGAGLAPSSSVELEKEADGRVHNLLAIPRVILPILTFVVACLVVPSSSGFGPPSSSADGGSGWGAESTPSLLVE